MRVLLFTEIESKYDKKMKSLREELELRRKTEIHEIEEVCLLHDFWHKNNVPFPKTSINFPCQFIISVLKCTKKV